MPSPTRPLTPDEAHPLVRHRGFGPAVSGGVGFPYGQCPEDGFHSAPKLVGGGSGATDPVAARTTFGHWDDPPRRVSCGFGFARSAPEDL